MKRFGVLVLAFVVASLVAGSSSASAATITSQAQIIEITATVGGQITVVINQQGAISQIFSNSDQLAEPVFVSNTVEGTRIAPTAAQIAAYEKLIAGKTISYGTLYTKPTSPLATWLSILRRPAVTIGS